MPGTSWNPAARPGKLVIAAVLCLLGSQAARGVPMGYPDPPMDLSLARASRVSQCSPPGTKVLGGGLPRTKSRVWFDGYKAGCMQFLYEFVPEQFDGKPLVIGVAGGSGSGKTTIKDVILEQLREENVAVLPHDNYYRHRPDLSDEERDSINFDHPESLETELMVEHLTRLIEGKAVDIPVYDFATHLRRTDQTLHIEPRPVIIVEGILILQHTELLNLMSLRVFVDVEADRRLIRRIDRDMVERGRSFASIVHQYLSTVKPMHDCFVEPSKSNADIIIPFGGRNVAAIQVLLDRLKTHLRNDISYKHTLGMPGYDIDQMSMALAEKGEKSGNGADTQNPSPVRTKSGNPISIPVKDELEKFSCPAH